MIPYLFLVTQTFAEKHAEISLTVTDLPFNLSSDAVSYPSMQQSLDLTYAIQRTTVYGIHQGAHNLFQNDRLSKGIGLAVAGSSSMVLFLTTGWMHEEWHRLFILNASVTIRGI